VPDAAPADIVLAVASSYAAAQLGSPPIHPRPVAGSAVVVGPLVVTGLVVTGSATGATFDPQPAIRTATDTAVMAVRDVIMRIGLAAP